MDLTVEMREVVVVLVDVLCLFFLEEESLALMDSGMPSHFELTLGTLAGSFGGVTLTTPTAVRVPPLPAPCLRCCSANCSSAHCDGSFKVRKPSIPLAFLFFEEVELVDELLDVLEARLGDVRLCASNDEAAWELAIDGWKSGKGSVVEGESELEVAWEACDLIDD